MKKYYKNVIKWYNLKRRGFNLLILVNNMSNARHKRSEADQRVADDANTTRQKAMNSFRNMSYFYERNMV